MNINISDKEKVITRKSLVLKSCGVLDFHSEHNIPEVEDLDFCLPHVYILGKRILQVNDMTCL